MFRRQSENKCVLYLNVCIDIIGLGIDREQGAGHDT